MDCNRYDYEFLPDVDIYVEAQNKKVNTAVMVCKLMTKIRKKRAFEMQLPDISISLISQNFAKLSILTPKIQTEKFRSISL